MGRQGRGLIEDIAVRNTPKRTKKAKVTFNIAFASLLEGKTIKLGEMTYKMEGKDIIATDTDTKDQFRSTYLRWESILSDKWEVVD